MADKAGADSAGSRTQAQRTALSDQRMIEAAIQLIVERGTASATLKDIGEMAGYSRGLASYRFGSKAGLFRAVCRHVSDVWVGRLDDALGGRGGLDALVRTIDVHRRFVEQSPQALRAMLILWFESIGPNALYRPNVAQVHIAQRQEAARWVREGIADGSIRADVDPKRFAEQYCASIYGVVYQWLVDPDSVALRRSYAQLKSNVKRLLT